MNSIAERFMNEHTEDEMNRSFINIQEDIQRVVGHRTKAPDGLSLTGSNQAAAARLLGGGSRPEEQVGVAAEAADGGGAGRKMFERGAVGVAAVEGHEKETDFRPTGIRGTSPLAFTVNVGGSAGGLHADS